MHVHTCAQNPEWVWLKPVEKSCCQRDGRHCSLLKALIESQKLKFVVSLIVSCQWDCTKNISAIYCATSSFDSGLLSSSLPPQPLPKIAWSILTGDCHIKMFLFRCPEMLCTDVNIFAWTLLKNCACVRTCLCGIDVIYLKSWASRQSLHPRLFFFFLKARSYNSFFSQCNEAKPIKTLSLI